MVIMQGPNHIFTQLQCGSLDSDINFSESEVKFSIFLERAGEANMQLMFRNAQGNPIGEPAVQDLGGMTKRMVELRAKTRPGTRTVQALIYSPRGSEAAVFNDPFFGCAPGD
jgi:hypothetical protein